MGRPPRWTKPSGQNGVGYVKISNWKFYSTFIQDIMQDYKGYVWRGQADSEWLLESSLTRFVKHKKNFDIENHLNEFKYASRGRRGINSKTELSENEWWALGQHHGLMSPLLDWSESPFVAAYFSYITEIKKKNNERVVYAVHRDVLDYLTALVKRDSNDEFVEFINPLLDENARLVSQRGLFTKLPIKDDLESWIKRYHKLLGEEYKRSFILIKIYLPESNRISALKQLNRMNINSLTLFPDLLGASEYCNMNVKISNY